MPIDRKYGRVTLENPRNIGEDEPVFIFRAKDALLPELLFQYYVLCFKSRCPQNHLDAIEKSREEIIDWQIKNGSKLPDSVGISGDVNV